MLAFLLCACSCLAQDEGREERGAPTAEQVSAVESSLAEAFRAGELAGIEQALEAASKVPHSSVVKKLSRALEDERSEVRLATLQALRWIDHPDAVSALHAAAKDRALTKDPDQVAAILRALGQHADPRSIAVLAHNPFEPNTFICKRARLFGLARIRTPESLEALIGILSIAGNPRSGRRRIQDQMEDVRIALAHVTGVDQGLSPELWESWWRKNRRTLVLPPEPPLLPREMQRNWDGFFGLPDSYAPQERREDRGR